MSELPDKSSPDESQIMLYDATFCIVAAEFNANIVDVLVAGAHSALLRHGVEESAIELVNVPGAFELPLAAQRVARSGQYDGIVALAAIVRGGLFRLMNGVCEVHASGFSVDGDVLTFMS